MLGLVFARLALPKATPRRLRYGLPTAFLFALSCAVGAELQVHGTLRTGALAICLNLLCLLGLWVLGGLFLLALFAYGGNILHRLGSSPLEKRLKTWQGQRVFWTALGVLLLCWLPVWLAYSPGLSNYDIRSHMDQCISGVYSTLHPLLYTLLLKACLLLAGVLGGGSTLAIALLCGLQLLLVSGVLSYSIMTLRRLGASALSCLVALAFFALFPVFPLMAISTTKDVPYAVFALLLMVQLYALIREPDVFLSSWKKWLPLLVTGLLMGLLRYNGIVSLGLFVVLFLIFYQERSQQKSEKKTAPKRFKWRIAVLLLGIVGLTPLANSGLNAATDAQPSFVTMRDMASLPSQQLVRALLEMPHNNAEYRSVVFWYSGAGMINNYRPRLADYTKRYINVDHDDGWRGFARTWLEVGLRHPKAYVEAFLELNRGLWFIHDVSHANIYYEEFENFGYLLNNQVDCAVPGDPIHFDSKLPWLQAFLNRLTTENTYLKVPFLRMVFSIGAECWLCYLLFLGALYRRDRAMACAMGWMLCLTVILLAAPAVLVRYTLPVFLGNGVGMMALMLPKRKGENEEC